MTDTTTPYDVGDRVRIELTDDDAESEFDGTVCRVVHVFAEGSESDADPGDDREMARAAYRLESDGDGEALPVVFRHRDLTPMDG